MNPTLLVRYGTIPDVARFECALAQTPVRGERVVVTTHRGLELGTVLEVVGGRVAEANGNGPQSASEGPHSPPDAPAGADQNGQPGPLRNGQAEAVREPAALHVVRIAADEDLALGDRLKDEAQAAFADWQQRIAGWQLDLELLDLEWTLDRAKLVLYVLAGRGPETTRLALQAAAAGLAVEVQPVSAEGLVAVPSGGGCGSGGCGCGS
jgi:hypothetical protein